MKYYSNTDPQFIFMNTSSFGNAMLQNNSLPSGRPSGMGLLTNLGNGSVCKIWAKVWE